MNEKQAIDFASGHCITVTTDSRRKGWVSFRVGGLVVSRPSDSRLWNINNGQVAYTRGEAIRTAVEMILGARAAGGRS